MKYVCLLLLFFFLLHCSKVPPYARGKLAEPIMQTDEDALPIQMEEKILSIQEGAQGMGAASSGGGCGC